MKRNRYDDDPVINGYYENYRRAGVTLLFAAGLFITWLWTFLTAQSEASQVTAALRSLGRTVLGWSCLATLTWSLLQYAYAILYPRIIATRQQDRS